MSHKPEIQQRILKYYITKKYHHFHEEVFFNVLGIHTIPWSVWKSWKFKMNRNVFHFILDLERHRKSKRLDTYIRKSAKVFKYAFYQIEHRHLEDLKEMLRWVFNLFCGYCKHITKHMSNIQFLYPGVYTVYYTV